MKPVTVPWADRHNAAAQLKVIGATAIAVQGKGRYTTSVNGVVNYEQAVLHPQFPAGAEPEGPNP